MAIEARGLMPCVRMSRPYCVVVLLLLAASFAGVAKARLLDGDVTAAVVSKNKELVVSVPDSAGGALPMKEEEHHEISIQVSI